MVLDRFPSKVQAANTKNSQKSKEKREAQSALQRYIEELRNEIAQLQEVNEEMRIQVG